MAGPTRILGISAYYHDSAACLVVDGEIVAAAQEERFSRKKHDPRFPRHAVDYCLRQGNTGISDLDAVGFYEKPIVKFDRLLETYFSYAPRGFRSFISAMPVWLNEKLWLSESIRKELGTQREILFGDHHESHAASAFYPSPFEEAAILTIDAVGEWATASIGHGKGNEIRLIKQLRFPHSLGMLYSAFTYFTGFKVNSGEYKLMGLAPYGEPLYTDLIRKHLVDIQEDGSIWLNMKYFNYGHGLTMTGRAFEELFGGPPRKPEAPITQREMDLARSIQEITEEIMLRMAKTAQKETGARYLCLAGGVALNCVGNGRLLREGPFEDIWVQPAAGDAGGSLGVALALWHRYFGKPRQSPERLGTWAPRSSRFPQSTAPSSDRKEPAAYADAMKGSRLGPSFTAQEIGAWLKEQNYPSRSFDRAELMRHIAQCLADGRVVGLFQGRMEFGPRALGARSILADPRSTSMQSVLNLKIKFRESFRPFAPAVLREKAEEWFDLDGESPYMTLVAPVTAAHRRDGPQEDRRLQGFDKLKTARSDIPAVTHVDHSARIQTVRRETDPFFYDLLKSFDELTGCPILVNTSFNVRGEPIVCTPQEAYRCFMRTHMDVLVLESFILQKSVQPASSKGTPAVEELIYD